MTSLLPLMPCLLLAAALLCAAPPAPAEEATPVPRPLALGDAAPPWRLNDDTGRAAALADAKDKAWVVLAFYPKADTPGCTKEMCSLRDALADLEGLDARVYGISLDDVVAQHAFREQHGLTFPLLSDPDGSVARKYGVLPAGARFTQRATFVIDPSGIVRAIDRDVGVATHGTDLATRLRALQAD
jgi:peroxiredoxin Q/BCP